jgi:2-polyprenyl-6-methoxyphenol hydroxylase-like FAD-dependent oxidoreductase
MKTQFDVVVVGAGPVGLLAAIELTLGGASVLVLERLAEPSKVLKAGGIGPLGIEAMQRRGMAPAIAAARDRILATMTQPAGHGQAAPRGRGSTYSGHFAGLMLIRRDAQDEPDRLGSPIDQQGIEAILGDRVRELGIEVRRGCEVLHLAQGPDGVDVDWTSTTDAGQIRCAWLVGCDGGRSTIRKLSGFEFPGWDPTMTMYQAVADLDHPERLAAHGFQHTSGGMYMSFAGRLALLDFSGPPEDRDAPVGREEFEEVLRRVSRADVRVEAISAASRWTDNTRLVDTYRKGRVLLAGDAAHIHSPFGGQGLSLGLADAANLGWKLAAIVRGDMPESLIDSYEAERRPIAEAVLANTLAQVAIMRPDPQSAAMRDVVARLMDCDDANRFMGGMMNGLAARYDLGSDDPEVGRLVGDMPLGDGNLYDLMQDGRSVLLDASPDRSASGLLSVYRQKVRCVAVEAERSMLIRPDACVAWIGERDSVSGLEEAVTRWCGPA